METYKGKYMNMIYMYKKKKTIKFKQKKKYTYKINMKKYNNQCYGKLKCAVGRMWLYKHVLEWKWKAYSSCLMSNKGGGRYLNIKRVRKRR